MGHLIAKTRGSSMSFLAEAMKSIIKRVGALYGNDIV